jgi:hypothetical protein
MQTSPVLLPCFILCDCNHSHNHTTRFFPAPYILLIQLPQPPGFDKMPQAQDARCPAQSGLLCSLCCSCALLCYILALLKSHCNHNHTTHSTIFARVATCSPTHIFTPLFLQLSLFRARVRDWLSKTPSYIIDSDCRSHLRLTRLRPSSIVARRWSLLCLVVPLMRFLDHNFGSMFPLCYCNHQPQRCFLQCLRMYCNVPPAPLQSSHLRHLASADRHLRHSLPRLQDHLRRSATCGFKGRHPW